MRTLINTGIFFIYVLTLLLYWTNIVPDLKEDLTVYVVSSVTLGVMAAMYYLQAVFAKAFTRQDLLILLVFTVILAGHVYYSETTALQALNILAVCYLYVVYPKISIQTKWVYRALFWGFILMSVVFLPEIRASLENRTAEYSGFFGLFDSANSVGTLGTIALFSFFLAEEGKTRGQLRRLIAVFFIFVVIFASHQRAALLMLAVWLLVFVLLKIGMKKSWIFVAFLAVLALVGAYIVQTELSTNQELFGGYEMFGKEANTRGRSEQINSALSSFDITAWGVGRGIVNSSVVADTRYGVHNTFVVSLLEYGYLMFAFYIFFLFWLFRKAKLVTASFILAYHVILFVESENFFSNHLLTFLAFSTILMSEGDKIREDAALAEGEEEEEEDEEEEGEEGEAGEGEAGEGEAVAEEGLAQEIENEL